MGRRNSETVVSDESAIEIESAPKVRKTRTKRDLSTLTPLELQLRRVRDTYRVIEIVKGLDGETRALIVKQIGEMQTAAE